jgi:hypothetical protein
VRAGLAIDPPLLPAMDGEVDRPFMLMTAEFTRASDPAVRKFWTQLTGWRLDVQAGGAVHSSYNDLQVLMPQLAKIVGMREEELRGWTGHLNTARAVRIDQAYPVAFSTSICGDITSDCSTGPAGRSPRFSTLVFPLPGTRTAVRLGLPAWFVPL